MRARSLLAASAAMAVTATACLTHVPVDRERRHDAVAWAADWASASERAAAMGQPVLAILVAGDRTGAC